MANKSATLFIVDVGPSMSAPLRDAAAMPGKTRRDAAGVLAGKILEANLISGRKSDIVALVLYGCDETQNDLTDDSGAYAHVSVSRDFATADLDLARSLASLPSGSEPADFFDALIVGVDLIQKKCRNLKFDKRIYAFTDAGGPINWDDDEALEQVGGQLKAIETELVLVGMDFDDEETGFREREKEEVKATNESALAEFCKTHSQSLFSVSAATPLIFRTRTKTVRPTATFRGSLSIGGEEQGSLKVPSLGYNKIMPISAPSAKKARRGREGIDAIINAQRTYQTVPSEGKDVVQVPSDDVTRAYKFGRKLVPVDEADQAAGKLKTMKGCEVLGSLMIEDIPRHFFHGQTVYLQADASDTAGCLQFSALCQALSDEQSCFLARLVTADDRSPKIGALLAAGDLQDRKQRLYFVQLPFAQDVKHYSFIDIFKVIQDPSERITRKRHAWDTRTASTENVDAAMDAWIEKMDLMNRGPADEEAYKSSKVFSPAYHRTWQCVAARAMNPRAPVPEMDPRIAGQLEPMDEVLEDAIEAFDELKNVFKAPERIFKAKRVKAELAQYLAPREEGPTYERDEAELRGLRTGSQPSQTQEPLGDRPADPTGMQALGLYTDKISRSTAVADFRAMLKNREADLVVDAVRQMSQVITDFVRNGREESLRTALECLAALRQAVIEEDEVAPYQAFVEMLKRTAIASLSSHTRAFWPLWKEANEAAGGKLGPVGKDEHRDGWPAERVQEFFEEELMLVSESQPPTKSPAAPKVVEQPAKRARSRSPSPSIIKSKGKGSQRIHISDSEEDAEPAKKRTVSSAKATATKSSASATAAAKSPHKSKTQSQTQRTGSQSHTQRSGSAGSRKKSFFDESDEEDDE